MKKVMLTTDSTADLSPELFAKHNIKWIPLAVNLGDESFLDKETIDPLKIFDYVSKTGVLPKTAARSVQDYMDFFKEFLDQGYEIVHIGLSSVLSASHNNAMLAVKELGTENVYVIDGKNLSTGTGLLVMYAVDLREQNLSAKEIVEKVEKRIPFVQASFVVDTMNYLYKGGRCSGLVSIAATLLKLKPTIIVKDGGMIVGKKYMGKQINIIEKYVDDTFKTFGNPDLSRIFITHTHSSPEMVDLVKKRIESKFKFTEIIETIAGSTITSHCGKSTLGILYLQNE